MKNYEKLIYSILLIPIAFIIDGFVIMKIYNWIITNIFDLSRISFIQAIGISLIIISLRNLKEKKDIDITKILVKIIIYKSFYLLCGYIIYSMI